MSITHTEPICVCDTHKGPSLPCWSTLRVSLLSNIPLLSTENHGSGPWKKAFNLAGRLGLDSGPHNTSPCRGQSHQIIAAGLGGSGAHFLTLWGLWVLEITLGRCGNGERAVVRQQHCSILAVSNRQDDTRVI